MLAYATCMDVVLISMSWNQDYLKMY